MPPFQYESHANPYAASIGDLLLRRGDIAARAAEQIAAAQARAAESTGAANARAAETVGSANARAAESNGQIWGSVVQGIAGIPAQIQQQKRTALQDEHVKAQTAELVAQAQERASVAKQKDAALKAQSYIDQTMQTAMKSDPETGVRTFDRPTFEKGLIDGGMGHLYPQLAETLDKLDASASKRNAESRTMLAYSLLGIEKAGYTPESMLSAAAYLKANHVITDDHLQPVIDSLSADPTSETVKRIVTTLGGNMKEYGELQTADAKRKADATKLEAETRKTAAEATNLETYGRTTPGTPEEQYLHAITKGDKPTADRILQSIHDTANARKDPAAQAMARELAGLRGDEARARLEGLQKKNAPADIEPDVQTTIAGRKYIDLSGYTGEERNKARAAANASGVVGVSKEQANALQEIDNARANQRSIMAQISDLLPNGPGGRPLAAVTASLSKVFQTDEQKAAFASWRTAAIQTLRATAGSKGLRINQAEIAMAIENDIPKLTDTLGTAQQKLKNIETMLENAEQSILVRNRSVAPPPSGPRTPAPLSPGLQRLQDR